MLFMELQQEHEMHGFLQRGKCSQVLPLRFPRAELLLFSGCVVKGKAQAWGVRRTERCKEIKRRLELGIEKSLSSVFSWITQQRKQPI